MKKKLFLCSIIILSLFVCGCGKVIELTDEENHLIAEYAAELILKYDHHYDNKYYDSLTAVDTEAATTEETTEVTTEEISSETVLPTTEEGTTSEAAVDDTPADLTQDADIAKLIDADNISIKYQYFMVLEQYPSYDHDGVYVAIDAPAGYKLLILKFNLDNLTNAECNVDLYSKDVMYSIIVNGSMSAKPMLTILMDDLYTYQSSIEGSSTQEVVLLYQVSDSVAENINDLKLKIGYGGESKTMQLQ